MSKLICLEGIDGSGKTTLAKEVARALAAQGKNAVFVDKKDLDFNCDQLVMQQMELLKKCVWDYPSDLDLGLMGDHYWMNTITAWYALLKKARIDPLLDKGVYVVLDGWTYKYLARFSLKSVSTATDAERIFGSLAQPDTMFLLDIPADEAANRKGHFKSSEAGLYDGEQGDKRQGFVNYQTRVASLLHGIASADAWSIVQVNDKAINECVAEIIKKISH